MVSVKTFFDARLKENKKVYFDVLSIAIAIIIPKETRRGRAPIAYDQIVESNNNTFFPTFLRKELDKRIIKIKLKQ